MDRTDFQSEVFENIKKLNKSTFFLKDLYKFIPLFKIKFKNVNKKMIENTLKELKNLNLIESEDNHVYKIVIEK